MVQVLSFTGFAERKNQNHSHLQGKRKNTKKNVYVSHLNVKITASRRSIRLVLVYGLGEKPMMLATNKTILGKKNAVSIVRDYMSRWRIEEYFRFKQSRNNILGLKTFG